MPCMCGDSQCPSCGAAQGTLDSSTKQEVINIAVQWVEVNYLRQDLDSIEVALCEAVNKYLEEQNETPAN